MKKFLAALALITIAHLGCKKEQIGETGPCACSPITYPYLSLVVKNTAGEDMLNTKTGGSFANSQIKLYAIEANGTTKNIEFVVRPPFSYGSDQFTFHQLLSTQIVALSASATHTFYLKLGDREPYKLGLKFSTGEGKVEKLFINDKETSADPGPVKNYMNGNIFYLEF